MGERSFFILHFSVYSRSYVAKNQLKHSYTDTLIIYTQYRISCCLYCLIYTKHKIDKTSHIRQDSSKEVKCSLETEPSTNLYLLHKNIIISLLENQQRYTKITAYRSIPYNIQLQKKTGNINTNSKTKTYIIAIHQYAKFYHTETEKLVWCVMHNKHHVI